MAHLRAIRDGGHDDIQKCTALLRDPERLGKLGLAMNAHWAGLAQVAEELLMHHTISGRRVFEILDATALELGSGDVAM